eukprot:scaffold91428_cov58-Attheya_sp.AAC.2
MRRGPRYGSDVGVASVLDGVASVRDQTVVFSHNILKSPQKRNRRKKGEQYLICDCQSKRNHASAHRPTDAPLSPQGFNGYQKSDRTTRKSQKKKKNAINMYKETN